MRPTLGHTRPLSTRYRPAPLVPGSLAWTLRELYSKPYTDLRDTERAFMRTLRPPLSDALYTPVWSASEAEMTRFVSS